MVLIMGWSPRARAGLSGSMTAHRLPMLDDDFMKLRSLSELVGVNMMMQKHLPGVAASAKTKM